MALTWEAAIAPSTNALGDELKLAQAELEAEISKIQFNFREHDELNRVRSQKTSADYTRTIGDLRAEEVKLQGLEREYKRSKKLAKRGSMAQSTYEKSFSEYVSQRKRVTALEDTVQLLEKQNGVPLITDREMNGNGSSQLKPILTKIEITKSEILRLRKTLELGQLTAPCDGRITERHCLTGESTLPNVPVVEILENNSVEAASVVEIVSQ